ncbi:hypothetical protein LX64_03664 [Chitinophaga skermanii]|uniref:Uncharacterized protein n=1 Tax=Chitinophaga skermanii TaxID=331697 RepID=A0A327QFT8_9BACT|nr:hypothetical protein LX64_03664 [Chitinophaga skermanii]
MPPVIKFIYEIYMCNAIIFQAMLLSLQYNSKLPQPKRLFVQNNPLNQNLPKQT